MDIKVWPRNGVTLSSLVKSQTFLIGGDVYMVCELRSIKMKGESDEVPVLNLKTGNVIYMPPVSLVYPVTAELNCYEV
ncbi:hypothetical protein phiIBBPAA2_0006 [Pseudomonas phage phiIBB-PAA2]|uniref:Uncharacterized protein n=2 Tax=Bruynoghevirus TaxID=545932 RepID=A9J6U6_BPLUZ|nr:hypothetical protein PPLUZ24_gp07 [Bruynoghevirus LUZ24]YP_008857807.1 hypothetical protein phiIBBPAA2_0006 [Pseudomonas phage phiIBB-PAA2]YP_009209384.1 hypothetical protein AVU27_gp66 [Pseudomonas phage DL54]AFD10740.1 hypothetical protein I7C_062c [Pseudomonas phage MR299-2]QVJ12773.1 hypothetical protein [Pseudomonas phage PSA13]UVN13132.1 hypothetical protein FBPa5_0047 [Pseudomonas phage vB_PaeM_FBPa5]WFG37357.1 hypothetical protein 7711_00048 [Pseudomonas phage bmx-p1]WMS59553.1 hy